MSYQGNNAQKKGRKGVILKKKVARGHLEKESGKRSFLFIRDVDFGAWNYPEYKISFWGHSDHFNCLLPLSDSSLEFC